MDESLMPKTLEEWPIYFYLMHPVWSWLHDGPNFVWEKRWLLGAFFTKAAFNLIFALKKSHWIIHWISRFGAAGGFGTERLGVCGGSIFLHITISEHVRWMDQHLPPACLLTLIRAIKHDFWNKLLFFFQKMFITNCI